MISIIVLLEFDKVLPEFDAGCEGKRWEMRGKRKLSNKVNNSELGDRERGDGGG